MGGLDDHSDLDIAWLDAYWPCLPVFGSPSDLAGSPSDLACSPSLAGRRSDLAGRVHCWYCGAAGEQDVAGVRKLAEMEVGVSSLSDDCCESSLNQA